MFQYPRWPKEIGYKSLFAFTNFRIHLAAHLYQFINFYNSCFSHSQCTCQFSLTESAPDEWLYMLILKGIERKNVRWPWCRSETCHAAYAHFCKFVKLTSRITRGNHGMHTCNINVSIFDWFLRIFRCDSISSPYPVESLTKSFKFLLCLCLWTRDAKSGTYGRYICTISFKIVLLFWAMHCTEALNDIRTVLLTLCPLKSAGRKVHVEYYCFWLLLTKMTHSLTE